MMMKRGPGKLVVAGAIVAAIAAGTFTMVHAEQPAKAPSYFSFSGKRPTFHEDNIRQIEVAVSAADSAGRLSLVESYWTPKFTVPAHFHKKHAETFFIISGQVEWTIGGETHIVGAGDAVHIPPNTIHSVKVVGDKEMHSLMLYEPGGYEEISAYEASFTPEQRKDPKLARQLNDLADFHPVAAK